MPSVAENFQTMEYGPAPESDGEARAWLARHGARFGHFVDGAWTKAGPALEVIWPERRQSSLPADVARRAASDSSHGGALTEIGARNFWIFDMDGTLTVAANDFAAIKHRLGLAPDLPILEQLAAFDAERGAALAAELESIELEIARTSQMQPGARALLETLRQRGAQRGILTRNSQRNALETLAQCGLAAYFPPETVLGREDCAPKPSGAGIRQLLDAWGAPAPHAVMVGDFLFDLQAGREAGTFTVYAPAHGWIQIHQQDGNFVYDVALIF